MEFDIDEVLEENCVLEAENKKLRLALERIQANAVIGDLTATPELKEITLRIIGELANEALKENE